MLYPFFFFFFFFFFFPVCRQPIPTSTPRYIAVDDITLNCGASVISMDGDQRVWIGDMDSESALIAEPYRKSFSSMAKQSGHIDAVPYKTARISYFQFSYEFPVSPGPKFLRLYFFNASYHGFDNSTALFTVKAGSFILLSNFSASLASSSNGGAIYKEFCVNVGEERKLSVMFIPCPSSSSKFYAFINGIEIVSMPDDLYYPEGTNLSYVGQFSRISFDHHTALEMVVRLNVGGGDIPPVDDSGMFRKWSKDDSYFLDRGVIPHHPDLKPIYSKIPNYTAPDDVYRTAVTMGPNSTKNLVSNLTWQLPVDPGFDYLVRLHFCEIEPEITSAGERQFIIYIDNKTVEAWADVLLWSKRNETPVYKDYVVRIQDKAYLFVALQPLIPRYGIINVILNGLEVFKLSDDNGNFVFQAESRRKKTIIIASGTNVGIWVVLTCVVIWKLRKTKRNLSFQPISKPDKGKSIMKGTSSLPGEGCVPWTNNGPSETGVEATMAGGRLTSSLPGGSCPKPERGKSTTLSFPVARTSSVPRTNSGPNESGLEMTTGGGSVRLTSSLPGRSCLRTDKGKSIMPSTSSLPAEGCRYLTLEEIKIATQKFKEELVIGKGEFGKVYKGVVNEGTTAVAIKRLNPESVQGSDEFWTEIKMLSQLRHVHVVPLVGYCRDEGEMILVYDFMANGNLRDHLYGSQNNPLSWKQRLQICIGVACGLDFLHKGWKQPIIHRDVNTTNIFLDDEWVAKVSDSGSWKTVQEDNAVKVTPGYLDPDYAQSGPLTGRSDVYSFGEVLLEVLCGRKALDNTLETEQQNLANWAQLCIKRGTMREIIDPYLKGKITPDCFMVYMEVVESCVLERGNQRPRMNGVKEKLNFALKLQEIADAGKEKFNFGGQSIYPNVLSFPVASTSSVPWINSGPTESGLETTIGGGSVRLTSSLPGDSCPKPDKGKSIMLSFRVASTSSVPRTYSGPSESGLEMTMGRGSVQLTSSLCGGSCSKPDKGKSIMTSTSSLPREGCRHFTLEEIERATQSFKEELVIGNGGFGKVYKGVFSEGSMIVAIKRLNLKSTQGSDEFWTEIEMLSQLRHVHVVSLVGYCRDEGEMILIYDFMANGNLRDHLYGSQNTPLSWKQRLQICIGVARGLDYLHTGVEQPIIHRDVKTTNILLDDKWKAKVSDFGLCKQVQEDSVGKTKLKGTIGYLDPDYAQSGQLTVKSDVYSFGVVLLEVLCARKALDGTLETEKQNLANWAQLCLKRGTIEKIIDPSLRGKIAPKSLKSFLKVVKSCLYKQSIQRPMMGELKERLGFILKLQENTDANMEKNSLSAWRTMSVLGTVIRKVWKMKRNHLSLLSKGEFRPKLDLGKPTWTRNLSLPDVFRPKTGKVMPARRRRTLSLSGKQCRHFPLEEIKRATKNFKKELVIGRGGFGKVYKGLFDEGMTGAIKRLSRRANQGFQEFWTEIEMHSQLCHVHLVSLIGYCNDKDEMILVYNFMANGSLDRHLCSTHNNRLSWEQRLQICIEVACGLEYLHSGVEQPFIHGDVKPSNILLDDKWKAKISDFGLCRTVQGDSGVSTVVKGTYGYVDPVYLATGKLTVKSDVYSFGVVLLEVLCGRKIQELGLETEQYNLANWARECMQRGTMGGIIDPYLKGKIAPDCFKIYVEVVEGCVCEQGIQRPAMKDVKEKLASALELQVANVAVDKPLQNRNNTLEDQPSSSVDKG